MTQRDLRHAGSRLRAASPPPSARSGGPTKMPPSPCRTSSARAVADGMGGHENGQFASQTLTVDIASMGLAVSAADQIGAGSRDRVMRCSMNHDQSHGRSPRAARRSAPRWPPCWPTATIMFASGPGDSRTYLLRGGVLTQLSRDHTEVQDFVESGVLTPEQARTWPAATSSRAIGIFEDPELRGVQRRHKAVGHLPDLQRRLDRASFG